MRTCSSCLLPKDESEFYQSKGKLEGRCKVCKRRYIKEKDSNKPKTKSFFQWLKDKGIEPSKDYKTAKEWQRIKQNE